MITAPFLIKAQGSSMPVDSTTGMVTYENIVDMEGSADELYNRVIEWFNTFYPNARVVLKEQDKQNGKITGKHKFMLQVRNDKGVPADLGFIKYTIKIWVKDGKYRYKISEINMENVVYYGIEEWMKPDHEDKVNNPKKLEVVDKYFKDLIANLNKEMMAKAAKPDEDKW